MDMLNQLFVTEAELEYQKNQTDLYRAFEDYIKHFLSMLGYTNLYYQEDSNGKKISFWEKKEILHARVKKEIFRLTGKSDNNFSVHDPVVKWAYSRIIGYFSIIWKKELNMRIDENQIMEMFFSDPSNSLDKIHDKEIAETFYKILEPYILSHNSILVKNTNLKDIVKCDYCGSRYEYRKHTNCPSCGA